MKSFSLAYVWSTPFAVSLRGLSFCGVSLRDLSFRDSVQAIEPRLLLLRKAVAWSRKRRTNTPLTGYLFITIMVLGVRHPLLCAQTMTNPAPPAIRPEMSTPEASDGSQEPTDYPLAQVVPAPTRPDRPVTESDTLIERDGVIDLDGHAVITYRDRRVEADHIAYDTNTGEMTLTGHVLILGGRNDERIHATHGTYNLRTATGRFFEVSGTAGIQPRANAVGAISTATTSAPGVNTLSRQAIYTNSNPFLFSGRMVVKTGPQSYDVYDGTVTSCQLPRPDWLLSGAHFQVSDGEARATNSIFHLLGVPLLYLPYVTHPTDPGERHSGFVIPTAGDSSTRGIYVGEQIYLTLGPSADLTVGAAYYSLRGWAENGSFRYRGSGLDFASAHYTGLMDKLTGAANQGGEDIFFSGRRDLDGDTRLATNLEYLSSYVYREAFTDSFNQAVTSDIVSDAYGVHDGNGREYAVYFDRYQGIKNFAQGINVQQQVRIFHVPTLEANQVDHALGSSGLEFSFESTASGLKRTQPLLTTSGIAERYDVRPELTYPLQFGLWRLAPSIAFRETLYTRSRLPGSATQAAVESTAGLARSAVELTVPVRMPVVAADFATPKPLERFLGPELRHTIAPEVTYRRVAGVDNFNNVLRFDAVDVISDTNEMEYGVTQRVFRKPRHAAECTSPAPDAVVNPALADGLEDGLVGGGLDGNPDEAIVGGQAFGPQRTTSDCGQEELLTWRLTQKAFFDEGFGNAVQNGRRNVFTTTLDLSGVAFLTEPRAFSPVISRLRARVSARTDFEWDLDYDIGATKFTSSNVYLNYHEGDFFTGISYARLDAPGRFYTEGITPTDTLTGVTTLTSDFNQLRYLVGYGNASRRGLSVAANLGLDLKALNGVLQTTTTSTGTTTLKIASVPLLQYTTIQAAYNWNCCGFAVEYRKFELGTVENVPGYKFNFTLANIGAAGNLRRQERLF